MGKIKTSIEAGVGFALASDKQKYTVGTKPVLVHAETAHVIVRLKTEVQKADGNKNTGLFVYGKEGSDIYKITL